MINNTNLSDLDLASFLQRYILVHSRMYYDTNKTLIEDRLYDLKSKQLFELQSKVDVSKTDYGYVFYNYDGNTGFDLYGRLNGKDKERINQVVIHALRVFCDTPSSGRK